jgi:hypothetical protein
MSGYAGEAAGAFERSRACFEAIVVGLSTPDADGQTHAVLEDRLAGQGRELIGMLLQDHLDLRAMRERRSTLPGGPHAYCLVKGCHLDRHPNYILAAFMAFGT